MIGNLRWIGLTLTLVLGGCYPPLAPEWPQSEASKVIVVEGGVRRIEVRFVDGSARLVASDAAHLRRLAAQGDIVPPDRIRVTVGGGPGLAAARLAAIEAELQPYGIIVTPPPLVAGPTNRSTIDIGRYLVTTPPCPNWSGDPLLTDFNNLHHSNLGCATAVNLGHTVASPADLLEGRPLGLADAVPAAAATQRYQADKVVLPTGLAFGRIGAPGAAPTPASATGAGTPASQP